MFGLTPLVMLGDKLSHSEVEAAVQRLAAVQKQIDKLYKLRFDVAPNEWAHPNLKQRLLPDNSYAQRDYARAIGHSAPVRSQANW